MLLSALTTEELESLLYAQNRRAEADGILIDRLLTIRDEQIDDLMNEIAALENDLAAYQQTVEDLCEEIRDLKDLLCEARNA